MEIKTKILELRKLVPIPLSEATLLLRENDGDVEKCVYVFKDKCLKQICEVTGCQAKMAAKYYEKEKLDVNRTISTIRERLFDVSYQPIAGIDFAKLSEVNDWLYLIDKHDFIASLDYKKLDSVINTLQLIPELKECGDCLDKAKRIKDSYFIGYTDSDPLSEFVARHSMLDNDEPFKVLCEYFKLKPTVIKEIVLRHARNLKK